jgi:hypothetical protein
MTGLEKEKKYWIWFGVLLGVLLVFIILLFRWTGRSRQAVGDPYRAVPVDAFMMVETDDLPRVVQFFSTKKGVWADLSKVPDIARLTERFLRADSLFGSSRELYRLFRGGPLVISFHDAGKRDVDLLGVVMLPPGIGEKGVTDVMVAAGRVLSLREYNRVKIYSLLFSGGENPLYFTVTKGLLLLSPDRILLEKSIRQTDAGRSLSEERSFAALRKTAGRNEMMNLYLRADRVPLFLRRWLQPATGRLLAGVMPLGGWTELDLSPAGSSLLLNGFMITGDSTGCLLQLLRGLEPQTADIFEVIPMAAVSASVLSFGDAKEYLQRLARYRREKGIKTGRMPGRFREVTGRDPAAVLSAFLTGQVARVELSVRNETPANNTFVVSALTSGMTAGRSIENILKAYASEKKVALSSLKIPVSFDRETKMTVYHFPFEGVPQYLFGKIMGEYPYRYMVITDNYILWGNSVQAISRYLRFNILQQTLSHDPAFREFTDGMASRSNFFYFLRLPQAGPFLEKHFLSSFTKAFQQYAKASINLRYIGYEAISQNDMIYNNIFLHYREKTEARAVTVWESLLDTLFNYKPQLVVNHRTGRKEIFLQDLSHRLYLINASGRILWRLPVREPILGQAWQIDFYRNGKLQLLFNTRHYLYLIDRNGNFVEHFPVSLRSAASGPMALFDYEHNRNYRIFIPGEDKKVYVYDKKGNIVPGWKIPKCESVVRGPVKHFVRNGRDYIVFTDTMNLYILDRKGNVRVSVPENIVRPEHQEIFFAPYSGENAPSFVLNTVDGEICFVSLRGQVRRLRFPDIPDDTWFVYADLNGDSRREFLFLYDDKLQVMSSPEREYFTYSFEGAVSDYAPVIYTFSERDRKTGVTDATNSNIYLVNNNGKLYEGFPMKGRTQFSIGRLGARAGHFNLIVGGDDNFLYNYSVK